MFHFNSSWQIYYLLVPVRFSFWQINRKSWNFRFVYASIARPIKLNFVTFSGPTFTPQLNVIMKQFEVELHRPKITISYHTSNTYLHYEINLNSQQEKSKNLPKSFSQQSKSTFLRERFLWNTRMCISTPPCKLNATDKLRNICKYCKSEPF